MNYLLKFEPQQITGDFQVINRLNGKSKNITVYVVPEIKAFKVVWQPDSSKESTIVGLLDIHFLSTKNGLSFGYLDIELVYDLPPYIDSEQVYAEFLRVVFATFGNFTIFDYYLNSTIKVEELEKIQDAAIKLSTGSQSAREQKHDLIEKFKNNLNVASVKELLSEYPKGYSVLLWTTYFTQLKRANQLTQSLAEEISDIVLELLNDPEISEYKWHLFYKHILYYKYLSGSYLDSHSIKYIATKFVPILEELPIKFEPVQFLLTDTIIFLTNQYSNSAAIDPRRILWKRISSHRSIFITYPEVRTIQVFTQTGNHKRALAQYLYFSDKSKRRALIRKQYEKAVGPDNIIASFRRDVISKIYYPKLNTLERLMYFPKFGRNSKNGMLKNSSVYLGLTGFFIPFVLYIISISNIAISKINSPPVVEYSTLFDVISVVTALIILALAGIFTGSLAFLFGELLKKLKERKEITDRLAIGVLIFFISMFVVPLATVVAMGSGFGVISSFYTSLSNESIHSGIDDYKYTEFETLNVSAGCTQGKCTFDFQLTKKEGGSKKNISLSDVTKPENIKRACLYVSTLEKKMLSNGAKITEDDTFLKYKKEYCYKEIGIDAFPELPNTPAIKPSPIPTKPK